MHVLVASEKTQGKRPSDTMQCIEGELVFLAEPCFQGRRFPYGPCDCGITFRGFVSDEDTTTAVVREMAEMSFERLVDYIEATHTSGPGGCTCGFDAVARATRLAGFAARLRVGAVVERCVDRVQVRSMG